MKPDPRKVAAIQNFPTPKNTRDVKSLLGLASFYRKFIRNFSHIANPLTQLLKKDKVWEWTEKCELSFSELKSLLSNEPLLQYPDFEKEFIVITDASDYAIGSILSQGPLGEDRPLAYASRMLNGAERNYSTFEKEFLATV